MSPSRTRPVVSAKELAARTCATVRQVSHWRKTDLIGARAASKGKRPVYGFADFAVVTFLLEGRRRGVSIQKMRPCARWLRPVLASDPDREGVLSLAPRGFLVASSPVSFIDWADTEHADFPILLDVKAARAVWEERARWTPSGGSEG